MSEDLYVVGKVTGINKTDGTVTITGNDKKTFSVRYKTARSNFTKQVVDAFSRDITVLATIREVYLNGLSAVVPISGREDLNRFSSEEDVDF
jgi:hypothetical protein